jgi:hypothetical protein
LRWKSRRWPAGRGWMAALYVLASLAMGGLAVLAGKAVAG